VLGSDILVAPLAVVSVWEICRSAAKSNSTSGGCAPPPPPVEEPPEVSTSLVVVEVEVTLSVELEEVVLWECSSDPCRFAPA